jgi:hypothetical protein
MAFDNIRSPRSDEAWNRGERAEPRWKLGVTTTRKTIRRLALAGAGLFFLAWLLGGVGETQSLEGIVPYADTILSLGFVLAIVGAALAGATLLELVSVGVISGVGHFYKGQDHATHILSGWGLGLNHTPHILLGLILIGAATIFATVIAFYRTRTRRGP